MFVLLGQICQNGGKSMWIEGRPRILLHIGIDIGANLGYFTKVFLDVINKNGHLYSVEPVEAYRVDQHAGYRSGQDH